MSTPRLPISVSAPASSGNLGPGFDVLAMALELRNRVTVKAGTGALRIKGHGAYKQVDVAVNGKRTKVVRGVRDTATVDLRGLPKGRFKVRITVTLADGRKVSSTRRYRTCAKRPSTPKKKGDRL